MFIGEDSMAVIRILANEAGAIPAEGGVIRYREEFGAAT
jgi:hypothetical protein